VSRGLDYVDRMILIELVRNSRVSLRGIASRLNLGVSTVYTRIKKLESLGVLRGFTAEVDLARLGMLSQAFVEIKPRPQTVSAVIDSLLARDEVVEVYEISGDYPIMAKVVASDDVGLARAIERIASHEDIVDVRVKYIFQTGRDLRVSERLIKLLQATPLSPAISTRKT
jgi:DNA-binding Lrp family transcriptional regulator